MEREFRLKLKKMKSNRSVFYKKINKRDTIFIKPVEVSDENVKLITKWRKMKSDFFATKFNVNEKRTKEWLETQVIKNPEKILFLVYLNDKKIGHIGIFNYNATDNSAEIDNVLRGESVKEPKVMEKALGVIINIGFKTLKLSKMKLRVFSDNYKAINLYERCGLLTVGSIRLKKVKTKDGWKWIEDNSASSLKHRFNNIMEIEQ